MSTYDVTDVSQVTNEMVWQTPLGGRGDMADDQEFFYVQVKQKDLDIAITIAKRLESLNNESGEEIEKALPGKSIEKVFRQLTKSMIGYIELLPIQAYFGSLLSKDIMEKKLLGYVEKNSEKILDEGGMRQYKVPVEHWSTVESAAQSVDAAFAVRDQVPKMLLMGLIGSLEYHMANLIRAIIDKNPKVALSENKQVRLSDVIKANDFEEFKNSIYDATVDDVMRGSLADQVKWFEDQVGIGPISKGYRRWSQLVEIVERRNLFAHTDGVVSETYLQNAKKYGYEVEVTKGGRLFVRAGYLTASIDTVAEFAVMLVQVVWRKMEKETLADADDALGGFGYDLIEKGEHNLATWILEFAASLRGAKSERRRLMDVVNLANAYSLLGNDQKSKELLDSVDWTAASEDFQVCVAAVGGEVDVVCKIMRARGKDGPINLTSYQEWPVFFGLRDNEEFGHAFKETFGIDYVALPKDRKRILGTLATLISEDASGDLEPDVPGSATIN